MCFLLVLFVCDRGVGVTGVLECGQKRIIIDWYDQPQVQEALGRPPITAMGTLGGDLGLPISSALWLAKHQPKLVKCTYTYPIRAYRSPLTGYTTGRWLFERRTRSFFLNYFYNFSCFMVDGHLWLALRPRDELGQKKLGIRI